MKNILKKGLLWCLILSVICTIHPVPTDAAVKTTKLKAPVVREWKKTKDSRWSILPADGLDTRLPGNALPEHRDIRLR